MGTVFAKLTTGGKQTVQENIFRTSDEALPGWRHPEQVEDRLQRAQKVRVAPKTAEVSIHGHEVRDASLSSSNG